MTLGRSPFWTALAAGILFSLSLAQASDLPTGWLDPYGNPVKRKAPAKKISSPAWNNGKAKRANSAAATNGMPVVGYLPMLPMGVPMAVTVPAPAPEPPAPAPAPTKEAPSKHIRRANWFSAK